MFKEILSSPTVPLGKKGRFTFFQIKLWYHCVKLLKLNRATQQAASLSYYTIFSIIPLAIVILLIFQLSPQYREAGNKIKNLIYDQIYLSNIKYDIFFEYYQEEQFGDESIAITNFIDDIIENFYKSLNQDKGSITAISVVFIIWAALAMLLTVENAFNNIWRVTKNRNFISRIMNYWTILTLGPLLITGGIYLISQYSAFVSIQKTIVLHVGPHIISFVVASLVLFLLYYRLPNTKVQPKAAAWGDLIAALAWSIAKWGFGKYVTEFIPYSQVYGILGLVPLTVLWIFISWLIVLFGLQLAFTTQHFETLDAAQIATAKMNNKYIFANDLTAINVMREIAAAFERDNAPVSSEILAAKYELQPDFLDKMLNHFVNRGLVIKTSDPLIGFVPARNPANIKLSDISQAVAAAGFAQISVLPSENIEQILKTQSGNLEKFSLKEII